MTHDQLVEAAVRSIRKTFDDAGLHLAWELAEACVKSALAVAEPVIREAALRQAAEAVASVLDRRQQLDAVAAVLALIPTHPTQMETAGE